MPKKNSVCDLISKHDLKTMSSKEICEKYGIKHNTLSHWTGKHNIALKQHTRQKYVDDITIRESNKKFMFSDSSGRLIPTIDGVFSIRKKMNTDRKTFGMLFGKCEDTVINWEIGRTKPCKSDMELMGSLLKEVIKKNQ